MFPSKLAGSVTKLICRLGCGPQQVLAVLHLLVGPLAAQAELPQLTPVAGSKSAAIDVCFHSLPGEVIEYRSCEAVLDGNEDFGLFSVELEPVGSVATQRWHRKDHGLHYEWNYPTGLRVEFRGDPLPSSVQLTYRITNRTGNPLHRVMLHPCVVTTRSASFFANVRHDPSRHEETPYGEMYERIWLWSKGKPFSFASLGSSRAEAHLAVMREGEPAIEWAWWKNASATFDTPIIALQSRDRNRVLALSFDHALWASANMGDDRACFHLFPYFGRLEPGASREVSGRLTLVEGGLEQVGTLASQSTDDH